MTKTFSDGMIELGYGSNLPPGVRGQHVSRNYTWFRVDGGEWEQSEHRDSMQRHWECLECADSVAEFRQYLDIV